jgi:hypothetical protein
VKKRGDEGHVGVKVASATCRLFGCEGPATTSTSKSLSSRASAFRFSVTSRLRMVCSSFNPCLKRRGGSLSWKRAICSCSSMPQMPVNMI